MDTMAPVGSTPVAPPVNAPAPYVPTQQIPVSASNPSPNANVDATIPGTPVDGAPTIQTRLPTMGGGSGESSIALPMSGPSKRTMIFAGVAIAVAGIGLGALVAMRAIKNNPPPQPAPASENNVALVETPHVIGQGDAAVGDASAQGETHSTHSSGSRSAHGSGSSGTTAANSGGSSGSSGSTGSSGSNNNGSSHASASGSTTGSSGSSGSGSSTHTTSSGNVAAGQPTSSGSGSAPTPGDLAQLNGGGSATGSGIAPRGPSVGGYVQGEETDATGTMDPTVFSYVYRHYRTQVSACQSMATRNVSVTGTMRVRIRLGVDGHVTRTTVLSNTTNNADLATCITNSIRSWAYPRPDGGEVEFDYNFGFGS